MLLNKAHNTTFTQEFERRFSSFCERAPIFISFTLENGGVRLEAPLVLEGDSPKNPRQYLFFWTFNFNMSVESNIHYIQDWLKHNWYPILIEEKSCPADPTVEAVDRIVREKGISIAEAIEELSSCAEQTKWIVTKVNIRKEEILIENASTREIGVYKLQVPSISFLKRLREHVFTPTEGWAELCRYGTLQYVVKPKDHVGE